MFQRAVPQGRLKMSQDAILGYFYLRMDYSRFAAATQDLRPGTFSVVPYGTSRASLLNPGLTSWATLSRPCGTQFGEPSSHADAEDRTLPSICVCWGGPITYSDRMVDRERFDCSKLSFL